MNFSLRLLALAAVIFTGVVAIARDPHRLEHWQETVKALKKAGHTEDSEIMHWADHNLKRAETAALHPEGKVAYTRAKTSSKAKDESWFEKAKEWATGSKPKKAKEAATAAGTGASTDKRVRKPARVTSRTAASRARVDDEEKKHQEELAKRRKAYADKKAAEAKAEEKHQKALAKRREAYAAKKAEEAKALNVK